MDWAGELCTVNIHKGFPFFRSSYLHSFAAEIFDRLAAKRYVRGLGRAEFVEELEAFYGDPNALHPFREFNDRA